MSRRVLRYEVPVDDEWHSHELSGLPVHVASRSPDVVEFWVVQNDESPKQRRDFRVYGTGQPGVTGDYIGTAFARRWRAGLASVRGASVTVPRPLPYRRDAAWRTVVDWLTTRAESYEQDARRQENRKPADWLNVTGDGLTAEQRRAVGHELRGVALEIERGTE